MYRIKFGATLLQQNVNWGGCAFVFTDGQVISAQNRMFDATIKGELGEKTLKFTCE